MKKCKGINKAKGFDGCNKETSFRTFGLCSSCYYEFLTTDERGKIIYQKSFLPKVKAKVKANDKKKKNVLKNALKTLSQYESDAKKEFQKWVRLRDKDLPCISCNTLNPKMWHGGHFKKAEIYSGLIFDERNVNRQCSRCNVFLGGNEGEYRIGLVNRFGEDFVKQLEDDSQRLRNYKYTKDELIEIKNKYQQLNKLKNE